MTVAVEQRERHAAPAKLALHADASAESVAMLRVGVFLICAAEAWLLFRQASAIPAGAWLPFGFLQLLPSALADGLRSLGGQQLLFGTAGLTAIAAAAGILPRVSLPLATLLFIVSQAVPRALQGLVNHAQVPVMFAAIVLTLGPSSDALVLWPRRRRETDDPSRVDYQSTLVLIVAAICVGYTFISAHRLAYGGWTLFSSDSLSQWLVQRNLSAPDAAVRAGVRVAQTPALAMLMKVGFPVITLVEFAAPLCLFSRRFRLFFVPLMLLSHAGIFVLMRISFSQLAALYVVFLDSRVWSPVRPPRDEGGAAIPTLVLFDGVCGLCNRFVDLLVTRDHRARLRFASLQGETARSVPGAGGDIDSVVVALGGRVLVRSDAALTALSQLGGMWSFAAVLLLVPRVLRDAVYDVVARHRYQWFGKAETCRLPSPDETRWFLP